MLFDTDYLDRAGAEASDVHGNVRSSFLHRCAEISGCGAALRSRSGYCRQLLRRPLPSGAPCSRQVLDGQDKPPRIICLFSLRRWQSRAKEVGLHLLALLRQLGRALGDPALKIFFLLLALGHIAAIDDDATQFRHMPANPPQAAPRTVFMAEASLGRGS